MLALFSEHRAVPTQASSRIQRWALILALYEYTLAARLTTQHGNTDAMSRLPLKVKPQDTPQLPAFILMLDTMAEGFITCADIRTWTRHDP